MFNSEDYRTFGSILMKLSEEERETLRNIIIKEVKTELEAIEFHIDYDYTREHPEPFSNLDEFSPDSKSEISISHSEYRSFMDFYEKRARQHIISGSQPQIIKSAVRYFDFDSDDF